MKFPQKKALCHKSCYKNYTIRDYNCIKQDEGNNEESNVFHYVGYEAENDRLFDLTDTLLLLD